MTTTHTQPAGCDLDSLRALIASDSYAISFQSMGQYRTALLQAIGTARAAQAPTGLQDEQGLADEGLDYLLQYIPVPAARVAAQCKVAELRAAQAPQGDTRQGAHTCTPADERALDDAFDETDLDDLKAIAQAAPKVWYGTHQIADGITDEAAVALIEACSPDTVLALIAQARAAQGAGTAPVDAEPAAWRYRLRREPGQPVDGWDVTKDPVWAKRMGRAFEVEPLYNHPAPVSTAPSKSPEFEGIGDAPVSTAAATTASASEPDLLSALKKAARLLKAAGFAMTGTATSQIVAAIDAADSCAVPPPGWQCTRPAGHEGPCAAIQATSNDSSRAADGQQGASRASGMANQAAFKTACEKRGIAPSQELFSLWQDAQSRASLPAQGAAQVEVEAARDEVLEEAAKVCEAQATEYFPMTAKGLADAIRALKSDCAAQSRAQSDTTGGRNA